MILNPQKTQVKDRPLLPPLPPKPRKEKRAPRFGKRTATLLGLCALLVASSVWASINRPTEVVSLPVTRATPPPASVSSTELPQPTPATTISSFTVYREQMDAARVNATRMLDELISDTNTDATTLQQAQKEKLDLAKAESAEAVLRGLLAVRGYGESYVTVRPGSVNVVIRNTELTAAQTASILEMVTRETGELPENVKIVPAK